MEYTEKVHAKSLLRLMEENKPCSHCPPTLSGHMLEVHKKFCIMVVIIAAVTYLYSFFQPGLGVVIYLFAIPPILAAGIALMFRQMKGSEDLNTALLAYAGATIGVLIGADLLNIFKLITYDWERPTLVSVGGGSMLDALFLAGMVALFADFLFRSQEEKMYRRFLRVFREAWQR